MYKYSLLVRFGVLKKDMHKANIKNIFNMAEHAMNDWLMKGTVRFIEMKMVSKFSNIMN